MWNHNNNSYDSNNSAASTSASTKKKYYKEDDTVKVGKVTYTLKSAKVTGDQNESAAEQPKHAIKSNGRCGLTKTTVCDLSLDFDYGVNIMVRRK